MFHSPGSPPAILFSGLRVFGLGAVLESCNTQDDDEIWASSVLPRRRVMNIFPVFLILPQTQSPFHGDIRPSLASDVASPATPQHASWIHRDSATTTPTTSTAAVSPPVLNTLPNSLPEVLALFANTPT